MGAKVVFGQLVFAIVLTGLFSSFTLQKVDWELAMDQEGIQVYTKEVEGSGMKATKSVLTIQAKKEEVEAVLRDVPNHKKWMNTITKSQLLEKVSENELYAYYLADAPWPVSNRDIVSHYKISEKPSGEITFDVENASDYVPEKEDIVRIKNATSAWRIIPQAGKEIKLIYRYHAEPGGNVPSWLANQAVTDTPFQTVKNLRKRLEGE